MKMRYLQVVMATLMALPAGSALAAGNVNVLEGLYAGGSFGRAEADDLCEVSIGKCEDNDNAWKLFAGYQFTPNWALEGAYVDLGSFSDRAGDLLTIKTQADALSLAIVGVAPYSDQFAAFAKAGAFRWDLDVRQDSVLFPQNSTAMNDDGISLQLGIGAKLDFTPNLGMRAEWEWYQDVGDRDVTGKQDVNMLSLGLFASF